MFSRLLLERCLRAAIAAALATIATQLASSDVSVPSVRTLTIAIGAAGISALMSVLSQVVGDPNSTSFTKTQVDTPSGPWK